MKWLLSLSLKAKIIIAACIVTAAVTVTAVIISNSQDAYRVIKVFEIDGKAVVTRKNTGELEAYEGMNLESGDLLSVDDNSSMRISLDGDKYVLLEGGTVLELVAEGTASDSRTVINLRKGAVLNEIQNALSANSSYEVNTPKATMAVRGTVFYVTLTENEDGSYTAEVYTSEGKVAVILLDEEGNPKGEEVLVTAGNTVTILTEKNPLTGNVASVDGTSSFVFRTEDGTIIKCDDENPVYVFPYGPETLSDETENLTETTTETQTEPETDEYSDSESTSENVSETESSVTTVPFYDAELPVSDVPIVTAVPAEYNDDVPVTPSEIPSVTESEPAVTTVPVSEPEITVSDVPKETSVSAKKTDTQTKKTEKETQELSVSDTESEKKTVTESSITSAAETVQTTVPTSETHPATTPTAPPFTSPIYTRPVTSVTESTETSAPDESEETTSAAEEAPVHRVVFYDSNGNVVSSMDIENNSTLGTLPTISGTAPKGYSQTWASNGTAITGNTVITSDMDIRVTNTPLPVKVIVGVPVGTPDGSGTENLAVFTVPYDGKLSDSGYNIESLTQMARQHYSDYNRSYEVRSVNVLYDNYKDASDDTEISGDGVIEENGEFICYIVYNFTTE